MSDLAIEVALSNLTDSPVILREGSFRTIAGYWFWLLSSHPNRERLRAAPGIEAVTYGKRIRSPDALREREIGFRNSIFIALLAKVSLHQEVANALRESSVPIEPLISACKATFGVEECLWLAGMWSETRRRLQTALPLVPPTLPELERLAVVESSDLRLFAIQEIERRFIGHPVGFEVLSLRVIADPVPAVRAQVIRSIASGWHDHPMAMRLVEERACLDQDSSVRRTAAQELFKAWPADGAVICFLKRLANKDPSYEVRRFAGRKFQSRRTIPEMLASQNPNILMEGIRKSSNSTVPVSQKLSFLRPIFLHHPEATIRLAALSCSKKIIGLDPGWLPDFEVVAANDPSAHVRETLVQWILNRASGRNNTSTFLKSRMKADPAPEIRCRIIKHRAQFLSDSKECLEALEFIVEQDPAPSVRQAALQAILESDSLSPQTCDFLASRMQTDPSDEIRRFLLRQCSRVLRGRSYGVTLLTVITSEDSSAESRALAGNLLISEYHDHPKVGDLMRQRAKSDQAASVRCALTTSIARRFQHDPITGDFLENQATGDLSAEVRECAAKEFIQHFTAHPQSLRILLQRIQHHELPEERRHALRLAGARTVSEESSPLISALRDSAVLDPEQSIREEAVQLLAKSVPSESWFIQLLRQRICEENATSLRHRFLNLLLELPQAAKPSTEFLEERERDDIDEVIRTRAAQAMLDRHPQNPAARVAWEKFERHEETRKRIAQTANDCISSIRQDPSLSGGASLPGLSSLKSRFDNEIRTLVRDPLPPGPARHLFQSVTNLICIKVSEIMTAHLRIPESSLPPGRHNLSSETWGQHILRTNTLGAYVVTDSELRPQGSGCIIYRFTLELHESCKQVIYKFLQILQDLANCYTTAGMPTTPVTEASTSALLFLLKDQQFYRGRGALEATLESGIDPMTVASFLGTVGFQLPPEEASLLKYYPDNDSRYPPDKSAFSVDDDEAFRLLLLGASRGGGPIVLELLRRFESDEEPSVRALASELIQERARINFDQNET